MTEDLEKELYFYKVEYQALKTVIDAALTNLKQITLLENANLDKHIDTLRKRLEAVEKELASIKIRNLANAIKQICDECGHTTTEDGCAFCIKKANGELVKQLELIRQSVSIGSDGRLELEDEEKFAKAYATAEALKGWG